jgi:hypothetical protein
VCSPSAIIKRKPLSSTARRAGWVGCNFALNRVPVEARISVVTESEVSPEKVVREQFRRVKPLKEITVGRRCCAAPILGQSGSSAPPSWTLDVLNAIRRLGKTEFATANAYAFTRELEQLHPNNWQVRDNPVNYMVTRGRPRKRLRLTRQESANPDKQHRDAMRDYCCMSSVFASLRRDKSAASGVCRKANRRKSAKFMDCYWVESGVFSTAFLRVTSAITMCIHP